MPDKPSSTTAIIYARTFELVIQKLDNQEYKDALSISERLLHSLPVASTDFITRIKCLMYAGDALCKLHLFDAALDRYEEAHSIATKHNVFESKQELMQILYRIERCLNALSMSVKVEAVDQELKALLAAKAKDIGEPETRSATIEFEQELLEHLWADSVKAAEASTKPNDKKLSASLHGPHGDDFALSTNPQVSEIVQRLLIMLSIFIGIAFVVQILHKAATSSKSLSRMNLQSLPHYSGNNDLAYYCPVSGASLNLSKNSRASLKAKGISLSGPAIVYDGSFISSLTVLFSSNARNTQTFIYDGASLVSPATGYRFYDCQSLEYGTLVRMDDLALKINQHVHRTGTYPLQTQLTYSNPFSGESQHAVFPDEANQSGLDGESKESMRTCGIIVDYRTQGAPAPQFRLSGNGLKGILPEYRDVLEWHTTETVRALNIQNPTSQDCLFLICEKPKDKIIEYLSSPTNLQNLGLWAIGVMIASWLILDAIRARSSSVLAQLRVRK